MINETVECVHYDILSEATTVGQMVLIECKLILPFAILSAKLTVILAYSAPYSPPSDIHVQSVEKDRVVFTWNEVTSHCPSIRYVITAINCGACPNITTNAMVTCSDFNVSTNIITSKCKFAVQTEICGYLLGEMSNYSVVNLIGELILL